MATTTKRLTASERERLRKESRQTGGTATAAQKELAELRERARSRKAELAQLGVEPVQPSIEFQHAELVSDFETFKTAFDTALDRFEGEAVDGLIRMIGFRGGVYFFTGGTELSRANSAGSVGFNAEFVNKLPAATLEALAGATLCEAFVRITMPAFETAAEFADAVDAMAVAYGFDVAALDAAAAKL
jgi:hypothetical protein